MKKKWNCCFLFRRRTATKLVRVMRLTMLFLIVSFMHVAASSYSQSKNSITLKLKNATVEEALKTIQNNSGIDIFFQSEMIPKETKVDINAESSSIGEIMDAVLKHTDLTYRMIDESIVIVPKTSSDIRSIQQDEIIITGKVMDVNGEPLPGVNVFEKTNTTHGVITGIDGTYSIIVSSNDAVLSFSYIGFEEQKISLAGRNKMDVFLVEEFTDLDEIVVVGYGTQKKVNLTGAVEQITSDMLDSKSVATVGQALQGVVPNLNITVSNGNPNSTPSFNIRGGTSFALNSDNNKWEMNNGEPLILIDGMEMDINRLNPEDIESISVIKDASAAAIYGARGSYGVMLVTTKKGKKGEAPKVTYSGTYQIEKPHRTPDLLNSLQYQEAYMNAKILDGGTPNSLDEQRLEYVRNYYENPETAPYYFMNGNSIEWVANTDPYKELMRDYAPMQKHTVSISGGGDKSTYYASLGFQDHEGILDAKTDLNQRFNGVLGFTSEVNDWFSVNMKAVYSQIIAEIPLAGAGLNENSIFQAVANEPNRNIFMPVQLPADSPVGAMYTDNKVGYLRYGTNDRKSKSEDLAFQVGTTINLLRGLDFKSDFSYKSYNYFRKDVQPVHERIENSWTNVTTVHTYPGYVQKDYSNSSKYAINAYFNYEKSLSNHNFSGVAGFNQEWYKYSTFWAKGEHLLTDDVPVLGMTTGETKYIGDSEGHWAIRGAFMRLSYNYAGKYLVEMNGRYDGTSRFPTDDRFQFYPSFSAGWRISEEIFMENIRPVLTNLKLRASYGSLGNQNVDNYAYIPSYGITSEVAHLFGGVRPKGITPPDLVSASLTWETATTVDFGFDALLWNKLSMSYDWYRRNTSDILTAGEQLPKVLGADVPKKNSGEMETTGFELTVRWNDKLANGLKYGVSLVLSDYQSEIIKFNGNPEKLLSSLYGGMKMGEIWGYETVGIFQYKEDIETAPDQSKINSGVWRPGDIQYKNLNDDEIIDNGLSTVADPGDRKIIGNSTPRYQYGFNADAQWKNFDFNMFWQGVGKRDYWIGSTYYWGMIGNGTGTEWGLNNSWTPDRRNAFLPAYKSAGKNMQVQTRYLQNASYLKLRNLTLGYTLPVELTSKVDIDKFRVYFSGNNLLSLSDVPDVFDPEVMTGTYPMMRSYVFGVQVTF